MKEKYILSNLFKMMFKNVYKTYQNFICHT